MFRCAFLFLFIATGVVAEGKQPSSVTPVEVPKSLSSPRATIGTFLEAMKAVKAGQSDRIDDAISTLDLSEESVLIRKELGRDLAWMLLEVIDRTRIVGVSKLSNRKTGKPYIFQRYKSGVIRVSLVADGRWLFDKNTIAKLPLINDELANKEKVKGAKNTDDTYLPWSIRIRSKLPDDLKHVTLFLETWQWIGILTIIVVGVVLDKLIALLLRGIVRIWRARTKHKEFREISDQILRPFGLMVMAIIWWVGINVLGLPADVMLILLVAVKFLVCLSTVWTAYRLVDLIGARLMIRAARTETTIDDVLFPLIPKSLKIFITVIGFVFIADNMNMDITSLLAGLGLGGLAFALAAKDMVQNLFGSITIFLDRPFTIGDWIIVDDIEGTVEVIGFRSTRIRTFYNSCISVPNARFITADVDNMGQRTYRRFKCNIGLAYDTTPDRIEAFCEGVREIVRLHPYMRKDYYHIYLNNYAPSTLDVLVYVFWETPDWATELRERHRFLLDVLRLANALKVELAFPTQTLYMKNLEPVEIVSQANQQEAHNHGKQTAANIVAETSGYVKEPPVKF